MRPLTLRAAVKQAPGHRARISYSFHNCEIALASGYLYNDIKRISLTLTSLPKLMTLAGFLVLHPTPSLINRIRRRCEHCDSTDGMSSATCTLLSNSSLQIGVYVKPSKWVSNVRQMLQRIKLRSCGNLTFPVHFDSAKPCLLPKSASTWANFFRELSVLVRIENLLQTLCRLVPEVVCTRQRCQMAWCIKLVWKSRLAQFPRSQADSNHW